MLNETFYLDGIDARSVGIQLQAPIEFSEAVPVVEAQTIPGRNGDLIWVTGSYENRSGSASCFCLNNDVDKYLSAAGQFLMKKKGYRRLETSDDPDHFWLARVENSPRIERRMRTLAPFEIGFDCKPQRFLKSGEEEIPYSGPSTIFNFTQYDAFPLIKLRSRNAVENVFVRIGDYEIHIKELDGVMYLDSETMNAYNENSNLNNKVDIPEFPILHPGENYISFAKEEFKSVSIIPRWWEL